MDNNPTLAPADGWDESLSVGNAQLNEQHRVLWRLSRELLGVLRTPIIDDPSTLALLQRFAEAAREHFATEETVLEKNQCPLRQAHQAEHEEFLAWLDRVLWLGQRKPLDKAYIVENLMAWLRTHAREMDQRSHLAG